jgi:putative AdoMet-dependent methyltransferase
MDFDAWSESYEADIEECGESERFPFSGYYRLMDKIYELAREVIRDSSPGAPDTSILDIGCGTGTLLGMFQNQNISLYGVDGSTGMLSAAKRKVPDGTFYCHDLSYGLPGMLVNKSFDVIVSTYTMHHFDSTIQIELINSLYRCLKKEGRLLLGDVCFEGSHDAKVCRESSSDRWDPSENYMVLSDISEAISPAHTHYHKTSFCSGILELW